MKNKNVIEFIALGECFQNKDNWWIGEDFIHMESDGSKCIDWCNVVAWFINCDCARIGFTQRILTGEDVWNSSTGGELYAVGNAISQIRGFYNDKDTPEMFKDIITRILSGEQVAVDEKYYTAHGLYMLTLLFDMPERFKEKVLSMLHK
jgi:hypothetical protein